MSKIASSGNVSKVASAADVASLDGGSITTEVDSSSSGSRQVADLVIGAGGFVHDPREEVRLANEIKCCGVGLSDTAVWGVACLTS